ncbi:MAG: hypothetical protein QG653_314 [Patescibacteria group bacterium]|nr:hypothetical protein [Patescibacteria group bacterium]
MNIPGFKKSKLDKLEETLYDSKASVSDTIAVHDSRSRRIGQLPTAWGDNSPMLSKETVKEADHSMSFGVKLLIFSIIFLLGVTAYSGWRILSSKNVVSSSNIKITSDIKPYVEGGEQVPVVVTVVNENAVPLENTQLILMYEKGVGSSDEQQKVTEKRELGTLEPNQMQKQTFSAVFYGEEGSARDVVVRFEYKVSGSNAVFNKTETKTAILKTPPIGVYIDGPELLSRGQIGTYTITARNNSSTSSIPFRLAFIVPDGFTKESTNPNVAGRDISWNIDFLEPGETRTFIVKGSFGGTAGEENTIRVLAGNAKNDSDISTIYSSDSKVVAIRTSPLFVSFNTQTMRGVGDSLRFGDRALVDIVYENKSQSTLRNIDLRLHIEGDTVEYEGIIPENGYYDSENKTIVWNKITNANLGTLSSGLSGTLRLQIPIVTSGRGAPTFTIRLEGTADSQETGDVNVDVSKTYTIQGSASLSGWSLYRDSPFLGTGPVPPVPNQSTTYTLHLVASTQNKVSGAKVSFILPVFVSWTNVFTANQNVSYDASSRTVTWNIGDIEAGGTMTNDIQVSVKPSQSHVGTSPEITSGVVFEAQEIDTRSRIRVNIPAFTTSLSRESWGGNPSVVVGR